MAGARCGRSFPKGASRRFAAGALAVTVTAAACASYSDGGTEAGADASTTGDGALPLADRQAPDSDGESDAMMTDATVTDAGADACTANAVLCDDFTEVRYPANARWDPSSSPGDGGSIDYDTAVFRSSPRSLAIRVTSSGATGLFALKEFPLRADITTVDAYFLLAPESDPSASTLRLFAAIPTPPPPGFKSRGFYIDTYSGQLWAAQFGFLEDGSTQPDIRPLGEVKYNEWMHLTFRFDRRGSVHVDVDSSTLTFTLGPNHAPTNLRIVMGASYTVNVVNPFAMYIDDVVIE